jgi:perosamine synthetase
MQAAIGVAQLERLDEFVLKKRAMGSQYDAQLADIKGVQLPLKSTSYADNIYWVYGLIILEETGLTAQKVMQILGSMGIGTRPFFCPMHQQPVLKKMGYFNNETYPVSERLYRQGFYIPSGIAITSEQISQTAKCIKSIFS